MKKKPFLSTFVPYLAAIVVSSGVWLAGVARADAQLVYQTDFQGSAGPFPGADAAYVDWRTGGSATPTYSLSGDGILQMTNPGPGNTQNATAYWVGSENGIIDGAISDGKVSTLLQYVANGNQSMGVLARVQSPFDFGKPQGYFAGLLRYNDGSGNKTYLVISKDIQFSAVQPYLLASSAAIAVTSGQYYNLTLEFTGDVLTASLYNAAGTLEIATISVSDSSYATGLVGLRTNFADSGRTIGYENFAVYGIPEGTSAMLLPIGLLVIGVAGYCQRRRSLPLKD